MFEPGAQLGGFEITGMLGKGGMGEVYAALDRTLGREVAIKILPPDFDEDQERLARFEREAKTLASLNHPNLATVYGFEHDEENGLHYLVMENISGDTLGERLEDGPLTIAELIPIFTEIARGLDAAHERGIVHRDLKPDNLKINADGIVKILDFGLAKGEAKSGAKSAAPDSPTTPMSPLNVTAEGTFLGTPSYMSPEQARGKEVDRRTDVWAFGCCLYQALTGDVPHKGDTIADTVSAIIKSDPDWSKLPTDLPRELERLLRRCLEKSHRRRPSSMGDIAITLEDLNTDLREGRMATRAIAAPTPSIPDQQIRAIAVLPFDNLMEDKSQHYLVGGMTDALTTELSKISALKVIARGSASHYESSKKSPSVIARELGVEGLVEGSVLCVGDTVRITARLIDGRSDEQRWSESFDGPVENILSLQRDVALAIAKAIRVVVTPEEKKKIRAHRVVSREVQKLLWEANYAFNRQNSHGYKDAVRLYERATELDPECLSAFVGLAAAYWVPSVLGLVPAKESLAKASIACERSLELDPDSSAAQYTAGYVAMTYHHDWEGAKRHFDRAIELSPNSAEAYSGRGLWYLATLEYELAARDEEKARELDPMSPMHANNLGLVYGSLERWDESDAQFSDAVELSPQFLLTQLNRHIFGISSDATPERVKALEAFVEKTEGLPYAKGILAWAWERIGKRTKAAAIARELEQIAQSRLVTSFTFGLAFSAAGDTDRGLEHYSKAIEEREWMALYLGAFTWFMSDAQRFSPRYEEILRQLKLPEATRQKALARNSKPKLDSTMAGRPRLRNRRLHWAFAGIVAVLLTAAGFVAGSSLGSTAEQSPEFGAPTITSLAVLPLENLMNDPEQDYFVDGMTEAITSELSKVSSLKVISRTSAMTYKNSTKRLPEIAEELGVKGFVVGSVMREEDVVRINVQLYDGLEDKRLWGEKYEDTLTSVMKLQGRVALAIADEIRVTIEPDERARISNQVDTKPEALDTYLRAQAFFDSRSPGGLKRAAELYKACIAIDDTFALAHVGLADVYLLQGVYGYRPPSETRGPWQEAVSRAKELDGSMARAYASYGLGTFAFTQEFDKAVQACQTAIRLEPSDATSHHWYGLILARLGRSKESLAELELAASLDPKSAVIKFSNGLVHIYMRNYGEAEKIYGALTRDFPNFIPGWQGTTMLYISMARRDETLAAARRVAELSNSSAAGLSFLAIALAANGDIDGATEVIAQAKDREAAGDGVIGAEFDALVQFYAGNIDRAYEILLEDPELTSTVGILVNPIYDPLRDDPRYWEVIQKREYPLLSSDHPVYPQQQTYLVREEAKALLKEWGIQPPPQLAQ